MRARSSLSWWKKIALPAVVLSGFLFLGTARAHVDDYGRCQRRIERLEWKLERDIERHGFYSRQARHRRHELREARARCYYRDRGYSRHDYGHYGGRHNRGHHRHHDEDRDWDDD